MAALIEIRAPTEDDDSWIPCASIQLAAEAIGVSVENLYRNLGPARADAPGDAALFNGFGVRRARRPVTACTSGRADCYCLSGRARAVVRIDVITGKPIESCVSRPFRSLSARARRRDSGRPGARLRARARARRALSARAGSAAPSTRAESSA